MATNPTVARKRHDQLAVAHLSKTQRMDADFELWSYDIEQMLMDYYVPLLDTLQQSTDPQDEELFIQLDKQYTTRMAHVQAARERMTECCAHLSKVLKLTGVTDGNQTV